MAKKFAKCLGSGVAAAAAVLVGGRIAFAEPPRVEPRAPDTVRETPREAGREAARDVRIDRRVRRAPGELGLRLGAIADRGLAIANLVNNSVFYTAGIRPGDFVVSVNGHRLVAVGDFDRYLYASGDQPAQIVVWRNGAEQTIVVQPNVLYSNDAYANYDNDLAYFGVEFDPQYTDRLVILRVLPDSLAFRAGLRVGDEITTWHGERLRTPRQFAQVIHDEKPGRVDFEYNRGSKAVRGDVNFERRPETRTDLKPITPPDAREPGRDNIPKVTPPAGREPMPIVTPPPAREPIPKVTPPTGREPGVAPPPAREPAPVNPPPAREPAPTNPPTSREPPHATPPAPGAPRPEPREAPTAPREK